MTTEENESLLILITVISRSHTLLAPSDKAKVQLNLAICMYTIQDKHFYSHTQ